MVLGLGEFVEYVVGGNGDVVGDWVCWGLLCGGIGVDE